MRIPSYAESWNVTSNIEIDEIGLDEARRVGREINPLLMQHAIACSAPILMEETAENGGNVCGGSCVFIRTPHRTFGVTAYHVIKEAMAFSRNGLGRVLIGQLEVHNFDELLISYSEEMDVATFIFHEEALPYVRRKAGWACRFSDYWPPRVPDVECNMYFCGWPASLRGTNGGFTLRPFSGAYLTHSITHERISIQRDITREVPTVNGKEVPLDFNAGGASGGPVFSLNSVNGLIQQSFSGIIVQESVGSGIIIAARADCIDERGQVRSLRPL